MFGTVNPEWARTNIPLNADTIAYAEVWNYESQKEELIQFTSVSEFFFMDRQSTRSVQVYINVERLQK